MKEHDYAAITWTHGIKHPAAAWKWCIEAKSKQSKDCKSLETQQQQRKEEEGESS